MHAKETRRREREKRKERQIVGEGRLKDGLRTLNQQFKKCADTTSQAQRIESLITRPSMHWRIRRSDCMIENECMNDSVSVISSAQELCAYRCSHYLTRHAGKVTNHTSVSSSLVKVGH